MHVSCLPSLCYLSRAISYGLKTLLFLANCTDCFIVVPPLLFSLPALSTLSFSGSRTLGAVPEFILFKSFSGIFARSLASTACFRSCGSRSKKHGSPYFAEVTLRGPMGALKTSSMPFIRFWCERERLGGVGVTVIFELFDIVLLAGHRRRNRHAVPGDLQHQRV